VVEFVDPDIRALGEVPSCAEAALMLRFYLAKDLVVEAGSLLRVMADAESLMR
jgi:hypothetical protein